ncbi:MAG: hypothetical protein DRI86_12130 [Bacteroidetes bacterium]|nr:MAG: hypothetical protein DRI86_12130 [Bacteroidota bacterium]
MKKVLLSLILLLPFIVNAQYFPLVKDGGIWRQADVHLPLMPGDFWLVYKYQYKIKGDTTINGVDYKKLYSMNYDSLLIENVEYFGAIREDSFKRVYYLDNNLPNSPIGNNNDSTEVLLYDFSLIVGDTFLLPYPFYSSDTIQIVESIDSALVEGQWRKRINFQQNMSISNKIWVEGIGDLKGIFFPLLFEFENYWTLTCYEDSSIFWTNPELTQYGSSCFGVGIKNQRNTNKLTLNVYPNPCSNYIEFNINGKQEINLSIINSLGNKVCTKTLKNSNGIFIFNTQELASGIYYYIITTEQNQSSSGKFIKI